MVERFDQLLRQYESGRIGRRELLGAVAGLMATGAISGAAQSPAVGEAKQLNHVTVYVPNVKSSVAFYQRLFGMPVLTNQDPGVNLRAGGGFVGIYPTPAGQTSRIDHVCLGLENFDAERVVKKLAEAGVKGSIRLRGDTQEVYFTDPDGIRVQLQDVRYRGGTGPLGDRDPK